MRRTVRVVGVALAAALAAGCGAEFDSPSELRSLRVLAVKKDRPYARPGDTVRLQMALDDASAKDGRRVNVTWFSGCENPPGDLYAGCFLELASAPPGDLAGLFRLGEGLTFDFPISPEILSDRPPPLNPRQPPFGTAFVFFAACAGEVRLEPVDPKSPAFPIGCYTPEGKRVGAEGFVAGYTQVFVYDGYVNRNPRITGIQIDGQRVEPECIGEACIPLLEQELGLVSTVPGAGDAGAPDGGAPDGGATDGGAPGAPAPSDPCDPVGFGCFNVCTKEDPDACPDHSVEVVVDPTSVDPNGPLEAIEDRKILEQMWVKYYVDSGKLLESTRLLNDAAEGWNEEADAKLLTPQEPGLFHLWAVAQDNRGGADFVRVRLKAR
ncbi:MAG: hypothetical protein FJ104_01905 [Deltaproteobacteria bacterium]|nr:hypothetical protein [Deltaproteobacteria bacterium]